MYEDVLFEMFLKYVMRGRCFDVFVFLFDPQIVQNDPKAIHTKLSLKIIISLYASPLQTNKTKWKTSIEHIVAII